MADTPKFLGTTTSATAINLYDNGATAGTYTVVGSVTLCNTSATTDYTVTLSVSTSTGAHGAYVLSAYTVAAGSSTAVQLGLVLDSTRRYLVANTSNTAVHVTAFGVTGP